MVQNHCTEVTLSFIYLLPFDRFTLHRIGNVGRLNVRKVAPVFDLPDFHLWVVGESDPGHQVMELYPNDLLYIGGVPDSHRSEHIQSQRGKSAGVISEASDNYC